MPPRTFLSIYTIYGNGQRFGRREEAAVDGLVGLKDYDRMAAAPSCFEGEAVGRSTSGVAAAFDFRKRMCQLEGLFALPAFSLGCMNPGPRYPVACGVHMAKRNAAR